MSAEFPPHPIDLDPHPPAGGRLIASFTYPDPQTKSAELEHEIGDVKSEIGEVKNDIGDVTTEIGEVRGEITQIKRDVRVLRDEVVDLRSDSALPNADLAEIRDALSNLGGLIRSIREQVGGLDADIDALRHEVHESAQESLVHKRQASTIAWATGATTIIAFAILLVLGWNMRQNMDQQLRSAVNLQRRAADSTARKLSVATLNLEDQIRASRALYLLTVRELDRLGSLSPQMQNRLIATLPVNPRLPDSAAAQFSGYLAQRDQDVITLLRPNARERLAAQNAVEAVVRLSRESTEAAALLIVLRRSGSDALSCHSLFKPVDGLNKLQCPPVEAGRYDLSVSAFLNQDGEKNPRPGYTSSVAVIVQ